MELSTDKFMMLLVVKLCRVTELCRGPGYSMVCGARVSRPSAGH